MRDPNKMMFWSGKSLPIANQDTETSKQLMEAERQRQALREEAIKAEQEFAERIKKLQKSI